MEIGKFQLFHKIIGTNTHSFNNSSPQQELKINETNSKILSDTMTSLGKASISFQAKKISPEIAKKIIEKSKDGISIEDIVVALGGIVSITAVSNILTQNAENEKIIEMYQDGATLSSIQYTVGRSVSNIIERLKKHPDFEKFNAERRKKCSKTKITDDMVFKMETLFKDNYTIERIAMEIGCSEHAVSHNLQKLPNWEELKAKYSKRNEKTILTPELIEEMIKKYESGISLSQIAKEMGCAHSFVRSSLRKQENWEEIEAKHNQNSNIKKTTPETVQKMLELYKEKKSFQEIAEIVGSNRTTVREQLKKLDNWKEIEAKYAPKEKISQETLDKILTLYKSGNNFKVISKKVQLGTTIVREQIMQQPNVEELEIEHLKNAKRMNANSIPEEIVAKMAEEYKNGKTGREIANIYGYSQKGIMDRLILLSDWEEIQAEHKINANMTYISLDTAKEMQKLYEQKVSSREIGRRFNCSKTSVLRHLKKLEDFNNLKAITEEKMNNRKTTPEMKQKMEELFRQGLSYKKIGKELNCSKTNVKNHLITLENWSDIQAEHLKNTTFTVITPEIIDEMINLYKQGKNSWQIGIILDIHQSTISRYINKQENKDEIKKEHFTKLSSEKKKAIEEIISLYKQNTPIEDICKKTGYPLFVVKRIINIDINNIEYKRTPVEEYQTKTPEELHTRIIDFYINNDEIKDETLNNIIYFLDNNETFIKEENKEILIQFCKDIDKIEQHPENTNKIIGTSTSIPIIQSWMNEYEKTEKALETMHENIGFIHNLFASNLLTDTYCYFEELIPSETAPIDEIEEFNKFINVIYNKLENPTKSNKNSLHNLILYHYYAKSSEEEEKTTLENAISNYNKIYNETPSTKNIDDETKERIGQIISISKLLEGAPINHELSCDVLEFVDIFRNKPPLKNKAIQALVALENYFNTNNEHKYLLKNFEPIARDCILDQDIMKVFMDKIYSYTYENIGPEKISISLEESILKDTNWQKLQPKEQADFIKTMENGIIDRSSKSQGRYNIIKYENKIRDYQIVELKINSKWRIFGYQDPENSKKFIFDKIGLDAKGLEKYQKEFFNSHNFE